MSFQRRLFQSIGLLLLLLLCSFLFPSIAYSQSQKERIEALEKAMASASQAYADEMTKLSKSAVVENWYTSLVGWPQPEDSWLSAEYPFEKPDGSEPLKQLANRVHLDHPGTIQSGVISLQQDGVHSAVLLDGNNALVFPKSAVFSRTQEFTICLELKISKQTDRAVVLHRTKTTIADGLIGYEILIEDGRFRFGLIHKQSSNSICIRCKEKISVAKWMHVALVYGGTNSANDTWIYIDGQKVEREIVHDSLHNDILDDADEVPLTIGARQKDKGVTGLVDQLQVYESALTSIEIAGLVTDTPLVTWAELSEQQRGLWREHYAKRVDAQCKYHIESFKHYFQSLSEIETKSRERDK